jgi:hypothetical protein
MKFFLLSLGLIAGSDGSAVGLNAPLFNNKAACVTAMQALSGKVVNVDADIPSVVMPINGRSPRPDGTSSVRFVCVPQGLDND